MDIIKMFEFFPEKLLRRNIKSWSDYLFHLRYFRLYDEAKEKGIVSAVVGEIL